MNRVEAEDDGPAGPRGRHDELFRQGDGPVSRQIKALLPPLSGNVQILPANCGERSGPSTFTSRRINPPRAVEGLDMLTCWKACHGRGHRPVTHRGKP